VVVDIKQHKSQFKNSNITITQCQKNFADSVMVKFEFLNCDLCCLYLQPRRHPYTVYKLNSFFYINNNKDHKTVREVCIRNWL